MLSWIHLHPAYVASAFALLWVIVPSLAAMGAKKLDATKFGHAFLTALAGAGFDGPKVLDGLRRMSAAALGKILGVTLSIVALAFLIVSCSASTPTPMQQADVAQFSGQQGACVAQYSTKADIDACRDRVKSFWCADGGALREAGACDSVKLSDGGAP